MYQVNGTWKEPYNGNSDYPYGYKFYQDHTDRHYYIAVSVHNEQKKGILPLKIKFDDTNIDEVETTFSFWENGETITSVKYNGKIIEQWQPKFTINE